DRTRAVGRSPIQPRVARLYSRIRASARPMRGPRRVPDTSRIMSDRVVRHLRAALRVHTVGGRSGALVEGSGTFTPRVCTVCGGVQEYARAGRPMTAPRRAGVKNVQGAVALSQRPPERQGSGDGGGEDRDEPADLVPVDRRATEHDLAALAVDDRAVGV